MATLLFLTSGNNLEYLGQALATVEPEQGVPLTVRNRLVYQVSARADGLEDLEAQARQADVVLFDLRTAGELTEVLHRVRTDCPETTFVPLMGGSMEILSLCRMGPFNMDRATKRSRGGPVNFRRIQQITSFIEKLGGVLPVGPLKHARRWVQIIRYWTAGGPDNIENLLRLVVREYAGGRGPRPRPPLERPVLRLEDPDEGRSYASRDAWHRAHPTAPEQPTVAVLYYGGLHRDVSVVALRALREALGDRAHLLPIATDGVQNLEGVRRFLLAAGAPPVHALVNLMWFRLDGGPLGGDPAATADALRLLDVPYFVPATLYSREVDTWRQSPEGLSPVETYATVVLPELDGAQGPIPVLGLERTEVDGFQVTRGVALPERLTRLADRILAWIRLARTPPAERRVALVIYDYPPGPGNLGNASYLDVSASLTSLLAGLAQAGYDTGPGDDPDRSAPLSALIREERINAHVDQRVRSWPGPHLARAHYAAAFERLPPSAAQRVVEAWGPPPGRVAVDDVGLRIPGRWFGHVFVGVQPVREPGGPAGAATHDRDRPPHHQYLAFYEYLRQMRVDAVVHLGTHGTVEFLPGKEHGLSPECYPDLAQGCTPQLYVYTVSNPSESSIARRRWQSVLVSHHAPDFVPAELYGEYQALLDRLEALDKPGQSEAAQAEVRERIRAEARELDLPADDLEALHDELRELQAAEIPDGLHVFGSAKTGRSLVRYLAQLFRRTVDGIHVAGLLEPLGVPPAEHPARLVDWARSFVESGVLPAAVRQALSRREARRLEDALRDVAQGYLADDERSSLLRGLSGRFVPPGLMGDPLRSPAVYPTGRNGASFDPTRIPLPEAVERGAQLARALCARHEARHGAPPRSVGLVLWGFETARTGGETVGQLLHLVGARLRPAAGWLPSFEPIPAAELERPRVDVYLMICGFFRDMFPTLVRDLDKLLRRIAALEEPERINPLRAHVTRDQSALSGALAGARIFGPQPGEYGTGLPAVVEGAAWQEAAELGEHFAGAMGHAYGERLHGEPAAAALRAQLGRTEAVAQIVDGADYKLGDLDHYYEFLGGATRAVENVRGTRPEPLVGDSARHTPRLEETDEALQRYSVTRLLNPRWIDGMLAHEYHGAKKIEERVTNLVGLAGTVGVSAELFHRVFARYVQDEELFERMRENNPHATADLLRRMGEASRREMWDADEKQLRLLRERFLRLDAELEG
jgi:cobaltochelatase CobN